MNEELSLGPGQRIRNATENKKRVKGDTIEKIGKGCSLMPVKDQEKG